MNTTPTRSRKERALELLRANRLEEARMLCEEVCRTENQPGAWYLLGIIHGRLGDLMQAESSYRKAIEIKPDYADAHSGLGVVLNRQGRPEDAAAALRQATHLKPAYPEAHFYLGIVLAGLGQLDNGILSFQEAVRLAPGYGAAYAAMGNAQVEQGRFETATASYRRALEINPGDIESVVNLGNSLSELGRTEEAIAAFRQAIDRDPRFLGTYQNLGRILFDLGRTAEAIDVYRAALRIEPNLAGALSDLGVALSRQNNHDEAIACYRRALEIEPDDAETYFNLGNALRASGKPGEAIENYRVAIRLNPGGADAHMNLALSYLALGNFREGWKEYDWQWRREAAPVRPFSPTPWDGADLSGKDVFLYAEQGLGDELFFLRFVPWLRKRGAGNITYRPTAKIASLIARIKTLDRVVAAEATPSGNERAFSVGDLPRLLGMERPDQIPPPVELTPMPVQIAAIRQRLGECGPPPYIGVTWRGGTTKKNAIYKESPLAGTAQALKDTPGTVLILQRHPKAGEIEAFAQTLGRPVHDLSALNEDLEQMLALLSLIDEYVGVSNTNMHLRAAAGKTARVLVPSPPEWRWMAEGKESPWFPGFRVYRQGYNQSWEAAFTELRQDLHRAFGEIRQ